MDLVIPILLKMADLYREGEGWTSSPKGRFLLLTQNNLPLISSDWISLIYHQTITHMTKSPPQHKQRYYYIFWSIATLCVVLGQVYVASSYRLLAEALKLSLL